MRQLTGTVALVFLMCLAANAGVIVVNFETVPVIPAGPSLFDEAGPMQTIIVPNVATFTGGVVLGNASNFPAESFATPPNVYATAGFGDPTLESTLSIDISASFPTTEVSFPLFNGATSAESYVADAYNGANMVASQTLSLSANTGSGFGVVDLLAANITSVTIAPTALNAGCCDGWDFLIDTVAFNESVQQSFAPEPGTFALLGLGLGIAALVGRRRRKA